MYHAILRLFIIAWTTNRPARSGSDVTATVLLNLYELPTH